MQPLNNIRHTSSNANDKSLTGHCLAFLCREVGGQSEPQNRSLRAGCVSVLLRKTSTEEMPADMET